MNISIFVSRQKNQEMMKKKLLIVFSITTLIVLGLLINTKYNSVSEIDTLREQHMAFLNNSPFKEDMKLSKVERKAKGIPPNMYYEQLWSLTMDPLDGKPHPERLFALQERLKEDLLVNKVPGENANDWEERGPDNVGGRTRAVMFDPNDGTNERVFAGGVSGGLWVNGNITDVNSAWSLVDIPENLAVSCITYDPNNTNTFYLGTGESYTSGAANGNGVWKSSDAGLTWEHVFGGVTGVSTFEANGTLTVNAPASIAGNYVVVITTAFGNEFVGSITGDLVLATDGTVPTDDICEALTNAADLNGKIAVIRRGSCNFTNKIKRAQDAGATAVIMINNVSGVPAPMGGTDATITIPSAMISKTDGDAIIAQIASGINVTLNLSASVYQGNTVVPGVQHINDIVIRDNNNVSEIFIAAGESFFGDSSPGAILGGVDFGLYKSVDNGANWNKLILPNTTGGNPYEPNDIEIGADNTVWVSTTQSIVYGDGGGTILSSGNGTNFTVKHTINNGRRTQIEVSASNANRIYVLADIRTLNATGNAIAPFLSLQRTDDAFSTQVNLALPEDADTGIAATNFTRGQAFYDLMLAVDPSDDKTIYVGGIDLFKSINADVSVGVFTQWSQLSHWYGGFGYQEVHADQHGFTVSSNGELLFSNDGGVYYSNNGGTTISARNKNYNTLQFYKGAIGSDVNNEKLLAGAQDNGSQLINNAVAGINSSNEVTGGDGAYVFIDRENEFMVSSYVFSTFYYLSYADGSQTYVIDNGGQNDGGDFINPAALDSHSNTLYANGTSGNTYQIFKYVLGVASSSKTILTNDLLTRAPSAFKPSTFSNTLFVGTTDGKLLKITNTDQFFASWADISGPDFIGSISCIELGATDDDIYVTFYNYGVTNIFYTDDGGTTWQNKEGNFPDIPVRAILPNPLNPEEVIIGTDLGVWAATSFSDASPTWYQSQNGMKDVIVTSFDLRAADNTVLASTYGRGMFTGKFTVDASGLSVDEFSQNNLISVYPTVSNGNINISKNAEINEGVINIFDINGRNVYSKKINFDNGVEQTISLNLSSGMYVVKFAANNLQSTHKIIIE